MIDNPNDYAGDIRELKRQIRELATHSGLGRSSISSGSLKILTPDEEPGGSITAGGVKISANNGGEVTAGSAKISAADGGKIQAGGTKIGADGKIGRDDGGEVAFKDDAAVGGKLVVIGSIDGRGGVWTPWRGGKQTVEELAEAIQANALGAAGAASQAQSRADSAWSLANGKASVSSVNTAQSRADSAYSLAAGKASQSKINEVIDALNDLEQYVRSQHPGKVSVPPIVKG